MPGNAVSNNSGNNVNQECGHYNADEYNQIQSGRTRSATPLAAVRWGTAIMSGMSSLTGGDLNIRLQKFGGQPVDEKNDIMSGTNHS